MAKRGTTLEQSKTDENVDGSVDPSHRSSESSSDTPAQELTDSEQGEEHAESAFDPTHTYKALLGCSSPLPKELIESTRALEDELKMPVWLLIQRGDSDLDFISPPLVERLQFFKRKLPRGQQIALVIDSSGGSATSAYQLAELIRRQCGGFVAVVPRYAKSAATLLALGADRIYLGEDGELGPLDAQIVDPERESRNSALDEVQSLERLNAFALQATHQMMIWFLQTSGKRIDVLLPIVLKYVSDMMRPLLEDIDAVRYTQRSRDLKIAEEYARRLLGRGHLTDKATKVAYDLVTNYPEHGFPIYAEEARKIGLRVETLTGNLSEILDQMEQFLIANDDFHAFGPIIEEVPTNDESGDRERDPRS